MNPTKGTSQTSLTLSSLANTASNDYFFAKFVSEPLRGVTSISANTWNYAFACSENNANANFPNGTSNSSTPTVAYVWRPSTQSKVGNIVDVVNSGTTFSEPASTNTETSEFGTFTGSAVNSVQDDDVIVFEFWARTTQGTATARNDIFFFDGTTETNNTGTTVSSHASYIETPQTLKFLTIRGITETSISVTDTLTYGLKPITQKKNISVKKGTITLDATGTAHDQAFTGVGFQPKVVIFWGCPVTANDTYNEGSSMFYGFYDGTNSVCIAQGMVDNVATMDSNGEVRNDACISLLTTAAGNAELVRASGKSLDSDGFTVTYAVKDTNQYILHYWAIGGSDITNVLAKQETTGTVSTGNKGYTGYGFLPDIMFFACLGNTAVNTLGANDTVNIGGAISSGKQFSTNIFEHDNSAANGSGNSGESYYNNRVMVAQTNSGGSYQIQASFVSCDSDGYTLNHVSAPTASTYAFIALGIKGGYWDADTISQATTTGNQTTSVLYANQDPEGLFLVGSDTATANTDNRNSGSINATISLGACDNSTEGFAFFGGTIVVSPTRNVMISSTSKLIRNATPAATATSTATTSESDIFDMSTLGQFTVNRTTADSTARKIGYIVLMKTPSSGGTLFPVTISEAAITVSDLLRRPLVKRLVAEATTVSEVIRRPFVRHRINETCTVTDSLSKVGKYKRYIADSSITVSDSIARLFKARRTINESVSVSELIRRPFIRRIVNETTTVTDTVRKIGIYKRYIAEPAITISERLRRPFVRRIVNETTSVTDTCARVAKKFRYIAESAISVSDSLKFLKRAIRTINESVSVSELLRRPFVRRLLAESTTVTDSLSKTGKYRRYITESGIVVSDALRRPFVRRIVNETTSVTDTCAKQARKFRYIAESISTSDSISRLKKAIRVITEAAINTTDNVTGEVPSRLKKVFISEAPIIIDDAIAKIRIAFGRITEQSSVTDTCNRLKQAYRKCSESVSVSDTLAKQRRVPRVLAEAITVSDSISRLKKAIRNINETCNVSDTLTRKAKKFRYINETAISIADSCSAARLVIVRIIENVCGSGSTGGGFSKPFHRIFGQNRASGF